MKRDRCIRDAQNFDFLMKIDSARLTKRLGSSLPPAGVSPEDFEAECLAQIDLITPSPIDYATISALDTMEANCDLAMKWAPVCHNICKLRFD